MLLLLLLLSGAAGLHHAAGAGAAIASAPLHAVDHPACVFVLHSFLYLQRAVLTKQRSLQRSL
jgi:hypothetical protein